MYKIHIVVEFHTRCSKCVIFLSYIFSNMNLFNCYKCAHYSSVVEEIYFPAKFHDRSMVLFMVLQVLYMSFDGHPFRFYA